MSPDVNHPCWQQGAAFLLRQATPSSKGLCEIQRVLTAFVQDRTFRAYLLGLKLSEAARTATLPVGVKEDGRVFGAAPGHEPPFPRLGVAELSLVGGIHVVEPRCESLARVPAWWSPQTAAANSVSADTELRWRTTALPRIGALDERGGSQQ